MGVEEEGRLVREETQETGDRLYQVVWAVLKTSSSLRAMVNH